MGRREKNRDNIIFLNPIMNEPTIRSYKLREKNRMRRLNKRKQLEKLKISQNSSKELLK